MKTLRKTTARTVVVIGSAKRLTRAIGGTQQLEPNMVTRYNFG